MDNNIKYLIEDIIKFDTSDYQDDNSDLIDNETVSNILEVPRTREDLINIIKERLNENKFGNDDFYFPDLSNIDVSRITDMSMLFSDLNFLYNNNKLIKLDLTDWDVSNVTAMKGMFSNCRQLSELDVSGWNVSNVTNMWAMFFSCWSLKELDLSSFKTSKVINMACMFNDCQLLETIDISNFDTSHVTEMRAMFANCPSLKKLDLSNFDTSNVTNMAQMFNQCNSLAELNVSSFNTSNAKLIFAMFAGCGSLTELDLSNFDTTNVIDMDYMFSDCVSLQELNISNFTILYRTTTKQMFNRCLKLQPDIKVKKLDKRIDMLTERLQKFNPVDYSEDDDIINNQDIEKLANPINDFLLFLSKYSWDEHPIGQLEMRRNSGRNNNKLFFVWKDIYTQINNLMDIYSDVYDSKVSNKDIAYVYIKPMDDAYQYGIKTTYVVIIDKNNPNDLNAICFQYVDWGPQHIIGLSYKNKYDIKEYPYLNPNTEYNGILPVEIITKIKQKFNLQGTLIENLNNFNPADYSDEEDDIVDSDTIDELSSPINDFINFLDKYNWERDENHVSVYFEESKECAVNYNKILNEINKLMTQFKEEEDSEERAVVKVYRSISGLYILTIIYDEDRYINISWQDKNKNLKDDKAVISILIPITNKYISSKGNYIGCIYAKLIDKLKDRYHIKRELQS